MKRTATFIAATLAALAFPIQAALAACHIAQFSPGEYEIKENGGKVTIGVQNPGPAEGDRTVDWETVNGTAKAGSDFVAGSGTLSFSPSDTSKVIEVAIINNTKNEPKESFTVRLIARPGSCISQDSIGPPATVNINDDDPKPIIPVPTPTKTKTVTPTPSPTKASPSSTPTRTRSSSPSPSPSPTPSPSLTAIAAPEESSDGGLSGGALAGIVAGALVLGGVAAFVVRRRFLS